MYELLFIVSPDAAASSRDEIVSKVEGLIKADGGQIISGGLWGRRKFAYVIEKKTEGYYYLYYFNAPSTNLNAITDFMRLDKSVLGRMILSIADKHQKAIKIWPKEDKPKAKAEEPATAEKVETEVKVAEPENVVTPAEEPAKEKPVKAEAPVESAEPAIAEPTPAESVEEEPDAAESSSAEAAKPAEKAADEPKKKAAAPKKKAAPKVKAEKAAADKAVETKEVKEDGGKSSDTDAE